MPKTMKILFLVEYFYPTYFGGSEVSAELFAKHLSKQCEIVVAAPNFENVKQQEMRSGFKIIRYPYLKHIVRHEPLSQFWHNSLILSLWRAFWIIRIVRRERIDIIHVQEKYLLTAGLLAKLFTGKKLIITIRDYQLLCPLGFCINEKRKYRKCNLIEFFSEEISYYFNNYTFLGKNKSLVRAGIQIVFLLRARIIAAIYRFCLRFADKIVFISQKQKKIYNVNGIAGGEVIYNIAEFDKSAANTSVVKDMDILFIGKPSIGKGIRMLEEIKKQVKKNNLNYNINVVGGDEFVVPSNLSHLYRRAKITIVPSFWEEPFGRVALESLANGTPVICSNRGGLPEIVENGKTGFVVDYNKEEMMEGIGELIQNNETYSQNIQNTYESLKEKFLNKPIQQYTRLYQSLLTGNPR